MTESTSIDDKVVHTVHRWWTAWLEKDRHCIDRLAHPAYDETDTSGHFRSLCHADVLAEVDARRRHGTVEKWRISEIAVHRVGRLIICNYYFEIEVRRGERLVELSGRASDILIQDNGELRYLSHSGSLSESGHSPTDQSLAVEAS